MDAIRETDPAEIDSAAVDVDLRPLIDISVIIPVYNERQRLSRTLAEVCEYLSTQESHWEVILADDGSRDDSAALAEEFSRAEPRVRLLRSKVNRGKGHAVRRGVLASRGRQVLYCDADQATPIAELARLRERLNAGFDAAVGSRAGPRARVEVRQPAARILFGRLGNHLIRWCAVPGIRDTQCGFKLFDGDKARQVFGVAGIDGWGFDVEVLHLFARFGWSVSEVPVRWAHQDGSKVRPGDYLRVLLDVFRVRRRHARQWGPRR